MQRWVARDVTPEKVRLSKRSVQNKLPSDRLPKYDSPIRARTISMLNVWNQLVSQECLKVAGASPVLSLVALCCVIRTAIVTAIITIATIGNPYGNCVGNLLSEIQIAVVRRQKRKQCTAIKYVDCWIALLGMLFIALRKHNEDVKISADRFGFQSQVVGAADPLQETRVQS